MCAKVVLSNRNEKKVFFVKPKPDARPQNKKEQASSPGLRDSWFRATMDSSRSEARLMLGIEDDDEGLEDAAPETVAEGKAARFERFSDVWNLSDQARDMIHSHTLIVNHWPPVHVRLGKDHLEQCTGALKVAHGFDCPGSPSKVLSRRC